MFDPIEIMVFYNNILSGYITDQLINQKNLVRLIDTHPTADDLEDNFLGLESSDNEARIQAKRHDVDEWELVIPVKREENETTKIKYNLDHTNLLQVMLNFFTKDELFHLIHSKDVPAIRKYLISEYFASY